jgi:hypothetical protein
MIETCFTSGRIIAGAKGHRNDIKFVISFVVNYYSLLAHGLASFYLFGSHRDYPTHLALLLSWCNCICGGSGTGSDPAGSGGNTDPAFDRAGGSGYLYHYPDLSGLFDRYAGAGNADLTGDTDPIPNADNNAGNHTIGYTDADFNRNRDVGTHPNRNGDTDLYSAGHGDQYGDRDLDPGSANGNGDRNCYIGPDGYGHRYRCSTG